MGNIASKNAQGQIHLDDILTDPQIVMYNAERGTIKIYAPDVGERSFEKMEV